VRLADPLYREVLWMFVCCDCCVLSGRVLFVGLIICTEESYGSLSFLSFVCCLLEVDATV